MKKQILSMLLVSIFTFGCAATKTVAQDVTATVTLLEASRYGKTPGDVSGKCNGTNREVIKYFGDGDDFKSPPATHPVWAYVARLDCSNNTDVNGSPMLFPVGGGVAKSAAAPVASSSTLVTETTTVSQASQTPGVIPPWAVWAGKAIVMQPIGTSKPHGCAAKIWGPGHQGQIVTYNGYAPTQPEIDEMARYIMSLSESINGSENPGYRPFCFSGTAGSTAQVSQTQYSQTQQTYAQPAQQLAPATVITKAYVAPAQVAPAPVYVAPAPAVVSAPKGPSFYAQYIAKSGYTVSGWQKANCLKVDGSIGPQTRKSIDDIINGHGVQSGCDPTSAPASVKGASAPAPVKATPVSAPPAGKKLVTTQVIKTTSEHMQPVTTIE